MAGPARVVTPLPPRIGRVRAKTYSEMMSDRTDSQETALRGLIAAVFNGKLNVCGTVELNNDGVTTTSTIEDQRIGQNTVAFLEPLDVGAATERGGSTLYQSVTAPGVITLTHSASVSTRTFGYALLG